MTKRLKIDTLITALSSESRIFKTERFMKDTAHFCAVDRFLSALFGAILSNLDELYREGGGASESVICHALRTEDGAHSFFFVFGINAARTEIRERDITFFEYVGTAEERLKNDRTLERLLERPAFVMTCEGTRSIYRRDEFQKLYRLSLSDHVQFPYLCGTQKALVGIEDENVLVQGVAGSGKTNICVDKILFAACRGYHGRVLYSTFSRGLLTDTKERVGQLEKNLRAFCDDWKNGRVRFYGGDEKRAIEGRLGISFSADDTEEILKRIERVADFLSGQVDYLLIQDFYHRYIGGELRLADENYFIRRYIGDIKNHQLKGKLEKIKELSYEVIYKEIYGVVTGCCSEDSSDYLSLSEYTEKRKASFSSYECEIIHSLAKDYLKHLEGNGLIDQNGISRRLLRSGRKIPLYSVAILDEVQDLTEINLCFMKSVARKLFCVGDALQMINPSFFSFAYLKRLLYEKNVISVAELSHNYRNTKKIADIVEALSRVNREQFGTHSFVLKGKADESDVATSAVYIKDGRFLAEAAKEKFNNYTIVVSSQKEKELLRKTMKKQEILTVSEIKGLEREVIVLYNILSSNSDKWDALARTTVNRKTADENSVFRYYFNLFYVGISRAKSHIYVTEEEEIPIFSQFFRKNFECADLDTALLGLLSTSNRLEAEQEEIIERTEQFIQLEQFENARFNADKILNEEERKRFLGKIEVYESLVHDGKYREAGVRFWQMGLHAEARTQFGLSGDESLILLMDATLEGGDRGLTVDAVEFYPDVAENAVARDLILDTVKKDLQELKERQKKIAAGLKGLKERKNGTQ